MDINLQTFGASLYSFVVDVFIVLRRVICATVFGLFRTYATHSRLSTSLRQRKSSLACERSLVVRSVSARVLVVASCVKPTLFEAQTSRQNLSAEKDQYFRY